MSSRTLSGPLPAPVGMVGKPRGASPMLDDPARTGASARAVQGRAIVWRRPLSLGSAASASASPTAFDQMIQAAAQREGVDEQLVKAVVEAESGFNPQAVSRAGAKGLMQLMDGTARSLGVRDPFDPASNITGGTRFLRSMLDRFGSVPLALAAYNAGPNAVEKYGGIPPYQETRNYVERVLSLQQRNEIAAVSSGDEGGNGGRRTVV